MTNDPRDPLTTVARLTQHLDNVTRPHAIAAYPDNDATVADRGATTFDDVRIQQFLFANYLATPILFGLGVETGTTKPKIFTKANISDGTPWLAANNGSHASSTSAITAQNKPFIIYQSYIYGLDGSGWWKYGDITDLSTATWTRTVYTGAYLNVCPPIVHSKDDIMYSAAGAGTLVANKIVRNNAGSWDVALTFSTYTYIPSICEHYDYLAIGANLPNGNCSAYLWDRDSSLGTISQKIDWGSGQLKWVASNDGILIGCSIQQPSGFAINPEVVFKYYNGTSAIEFARFTTTAATVYPSTQKHNNITYFLAEMTIDSVALRGIWKVVHNPSGGFSVSFDRQPRLDDTITAGKLYGFLRTGDYFHIACADAQDSDKYIVTKTGNTFATTARWRTTINEGMPPEDRTALKQLKAISVSYEPLGTNAGCVIKYRIDGGAYNVPNDGNFTTIKNELTDNIVTTVITGDSAGLQLAQGREFEFDFLPSGGARITERKYAYEVIKSGI
ncbi:hypothetical protein UNPF46_08565 [Bradyrhizobium sp. UNPF46]|nr:hypothetical protein UNPF46_08565 [Bradyrhizobium sp. UNPF46]